MSDSMFPPQILLGRGAFGDGEPVDTRVIFDEGEGAYRIQMSQGMKRERKVLLERSNIAESALDAAFVLMASEVATIVDLQRTRKERQRKMLRPSQVSAKFANVDNLTAETNHKGETN